MGRYTIEELEERYRGAQIIICGNGPSAFSADLSGVGRPVWTVNGGYNQHPESDLTWVMDDIHGPALRIDSNSGAEYRHYDKQLEELRGLEIPCITSCVYEGYPAMVEYPLARVLRFFSPGRSEVRPYFNETINYMVAWAVMIGVTRIDFIGVDYINIRPDERASLEYWIGQASGRGVSVGVADASHVLKMQDLDGVNRHIPDLYGYLPQNFPLSYRTRPNGLVTVSL